MSLSRPSKRSRLSGFIRITLDAQLISGGLWRPSQDNTKEFSSQDKTLSDYYKCPEELCEIQLNGKLSGEQGFFQFAPGVFCYGRCDQGRPLPSPVGSLFDASQAIVIDQGVVYLPFDLSEVVINLRRERYTTSANTPHSLRILEALEHYIYYFFRPWMPVALRKHLQRIRLNGWRCFPFPHWPVDHTVDSILEEALILCMKAKGTSSVPFIWFWPEGAQCCAIMTHDVETSSGVNSCRELMALDEAFEIRSSFQFVPEGRYIVPDDLLEEARSRGFEINVQDLTHDGNLFREREEFLRRAARINDHFRSFGAKGFRSAIMYRNAEWLNALEASYDMSFPSVAHLDPQRGGCCTIMPYFIDNIVELPLTTIQDYSLLHILGESSINVWERQIELIRQKHGLISFIVHPDYLESKREIGLYESLLNYLCRMRAKSGLWIACPGDVNQWWRERNQMKLVFQNGKWSIEGQGSHRARIAYAILVDGHITYKC